MDIYGYTGALQDLYVDEFQSQGKAILDICKYSLALDAGTGG